MNRDHLIAAQHFEGELYIKASDHHRAVRAAIAAEREACARMAEAFHQHGYDFTGDLELHDAIRARGQI